MEKVAEFITSEYSGKAVEVGVGRNPEVARSLAEDGFEVTATDIDEKADPDADAEGIDFVVDNVTDPDISVYEDASLIYSVRPPYELHRHLREITETVGADLLLVPLADEVPRDGFELVSYEGKGMYRSESSNITTNKLKK